MKVSAEEWMRASKNIKNDQIRKSLICEKEQELTGEEEMSKRGFIKVTDKCYVDIDAFSCFAIKDEADGSFSVLAYYECGNSITMGVYSNIEDAKAQLEYLLGCV